MRRHDSRGVGLVEVLVGLAVALLVLVAALSLTAGQAQRSASAQARVMALRELEALERLLERLVRQAVPADGTAGAGGRGFEPLADDEGLRFVTRAGDGTPRRLAVRLADGVLALQFEGGSWQPLHEVRSLRLQSARFEILGDGVAAGASPACVGLRPPQVHWLLRATTSGGLALPASERRVQVRDGVSSEGCAP